jgi:hypothetical protein
VSALGFVEDMSKRCSWKEVTLPVIQYMVWLAFSRTHVEDKHQTHNKCPVQDCSDARLIELQRVNSSSLYYVNEPLI